MTWWYRAAQWVALCTLLTCGAGGAAGQWVSAEFVMVGVAVPVAILIVFVEVGGGRDGS